ncbi:glutamyl-tRNA synthetase [Puccinia graminis f. sp. tritici CRL 75-36-700-3]|uniref:glutamate--tRNA ligase n=1 Tax=Puccinia graminis f. sp. tritici (strain CRL 75-36-700-3 / race SCCL) TaxID=418459 RepID=E3L4J4_PUCGT|nr:glutamyl-tRNA synthetase [Puccinia graminis f. sp. tritici CRL 75-36-700-3]EFP91469.2 glutamyl-tRNA synthetase [Puccinia graminis f. sp. tritici CRL 75-36-700-3]
MAASSQQKDSLTLKIYLRPTTALPPPAFGPLGLSSYLLDQEPSVASNLRIEYEDGLTGPGKDKSCSIVSTNPDRATQATDSLDCLSLLAKTFLPASSNTTDDQTERIFKILAPSFDPVQAKDMNTLTKIANQIDHHLTLRTFLVGYSISETDWSLWGLIKSSSTFNALLKRAQHPHLSRWFSFIDCLPSSKSTITTLQDQIKNSVKGRSKAGVASVNFDGGLPGAIKGQVVTRFPPEPSGYLHIGHCKAAILNQHYAKIYDGKFLVRFDDTNPSKEKEEFQDAILEDLGLLGVKGDRMSYTSDYFDQLYGYATEMISKGKAYCDDTEQEVMKNQRMARQPSQRRDSTTEENLSRFEEMKLGTPEGLRWCLRAKIRYDDLNGTLRDPVIYRCNVLPHHRTGEKWKIYPTYDFACPIVDSIEGVTHALRTNEYRDRNPQYWWMQEALGLRRVEIKDFARVNFVYTLLSKRKLKWFVETDRVRGWDDPRFATVRGIRRRGMTIQAMRDFMIGQGDSQQQVNMEWDVLWSINKRIIDPIVPRHFAISNTNKVSAVIKGGQGEAYVESLPAHKKNPEVGSKKVTYSPTIYIEQSDATCFDVDEEITLMDWGNAIIRVKSTGPDGLVTGLELELHLAGDFKKTKKKVHWLTTDEAGSTPSGAGLQNVVLLDYDYLITKRKIEDDDEIDDFITPVSEFREDAIADGNIRTMKKGEILQFERKGYYIIDKPLGEDTTLATGSGKDWIELIKIPDGRAAGIASKAAPPSAAPPKTNKKVAAKSETVAGDSKDIMFKVEPVYGNDENDRLPVTTKMYKVDNIYHS